MRRGRPPPPLVGIPRVARMFFCGSWGECVTPCRSLLATAASAAPLLFRPAGIREAWGFGEGAAHAALQRFVSDSGALLAFDSKRVQVCALCACCQSPVRSAPSTGGEDTDCSSQACADPPSPGAALASPQVEGEAATSARFRADRTGTARLSPYLRFGELSPRQVYARCVEAAAAAYKRGGGGGKGQPGGAEAARSARAFLRRLAWRDLFYWALWRFPKLPWEPLRPHYSTQWWDLRWCETDDPERALAVTSARRRWAPEHAGLRAWQRGETGYPLASAHTHPDPHPHILQGESAMVALFAQTERLQGVHGFTAGWGDASDPLTFHFSIQPQVDAAMRELWHTGWIPNYLRHVVASFLIEYLGEWTTNLGMNSCFRLLCSEPHLRHLRTLMDIRTTCRRSQLSTGATARCGSAKRSWTPTWPSTPPCGRTGATQGSTRCAWVAECPGLGSRVMRGRWCL